MHTLHLKSADSRTAAREELKEAGIDPEHLNPDFLMRAHQAMSIRELRFGKASIIVNRAITGDGKSLVAQYRLLSERWRTFIMYPTNELILDQKRSLDAMLESWTPPVWTGKTIYREIIDAEKLDQMQDANANGRADALAMLLNRDIVLSNPDIFHLMIQARYKSRGVATDMILGELVHRFGLFVFDEFHLFGAPQVGSVLIALLLLREITDSWRLQDKPKTLFLSATPQPLLTFLAGKVGLEMAIIDGEYQHGQSKPAKDSGWQRILQATTLRLDVGKMEDWIIAHLEDVILRFFKEHLPGAKGVIIVRAVATAYRVHALLQKPCYDAGINLAPPNTGLTPQADRITDADLVVATSTVDVGVDFRINLLIFESSDAASHMQRLGRLGRHDNDGKGNRFEHFEAYALLPQWVVDSIANKVPDGSAVDRAQYSELIKECYPPMQEFHRYIQRWSGIQAAHVLNELNRKEIKTQYAGLRERLSESYNVLFPKYYYKYRSLKNDNANEILNEAINFRGGSPFTALVLDRARTSQHIVSYNLITLLLNAELKDADLDELYEHAEQYGQYAKSLRGTEPLAGYELLGWLDTPRKVEILLDDELPQEQCECVMQRSGFRFDMPTIPGLHRLNNTLAARTLVTFMLPSQKADVLRQKYRIGYQLELFTFRSSIDGIVGTAAFGRDAQLLDSVINSFKTSKSKGNSRPIMI